MAQSVNDKMEILKEILEEGYKTDQMILRNIAEVEIYSNEHEEIRNEARMYSKKIISIMKEAGALEAKEAIELTHEQSREIELLRNEKKKVMQKGYILHKVIIDDEQNKVEISNNNGEVEHLFNYEDEQDFEKKLTKALKNRL